MIKIVADIPRNNKIRQVITITDFCDIDVRYWCERAVYSGLIIVNRTQISIYEMLSFLLVEDAQYTSERVSIIPRIEILLL